MAEEKKGHVKITIDIEISESLMEMTKEMIAQMPEMIAKFRKKEQGKAEGQ